MAQWNYCTLSQEILRRPIVACELGRYGPFMYQDAFVLLVLKRILKYLIDQIGAVLSTLEGKMSLCLYTT